MYWSRYVHKFIRQQRNRVTVVTYKVLKVQLSYEFSSKRDVYNKTLKSSVTVSIAKRTPAGPQVDM